MITRIVLAAASAAVISAPAAAQDDDWLERCRSGQWDRNRQVHCEVRETRLPARASLSVDAAPNGGVTVRGYDGREIVVRARVQAHARTAAAATEMSRAIRVLTDGGEVRAEGPRNLRGEHWSVSYEVLVPRRIDLDLRSTNGGLSVHQVSGRLNLRTTNGGLTLRSVSGDVRARTTNGGIRVEVDGDRWAGTGLDVQSTNGSVNLTLPRNFRADLEVATRNGSMTIDFPVTVQGRIGRQVSGPINGGGPPVRAVTTNGAVRVRAAS